MLTADEIAALEAWMDRQGLGSGPLDDITPLVGGTQNVMVRFERAGSPYVVRRGPRHLRPKTNDALRQEMTVLGALRDTDVPVPGLIAGCPDADVLGDSVFFLMEAVDGFNAGAASSPAYEDQPAMWHQAGLDLVASAARLGEIDPGAIGLEGVGRPDGFVDRQVTRWLDELDGYSRHEGYPGPDLPGLDEAAGYLSAHLPQRTRHGITHGDLHLANTMFRHDEPAVAAIVDWEMATVGDSLLDLGWILATWPEVSTGISVGPAGVGLPTRDEIVGHYADHTTRDLDDLRWFEVLANFKLGIVLEGTHARACAGKAPIEIGDMLHATAVQLLAGAAEVASTPR